MLLVGCGMGPALRIDAATAVLLGKVTQITGPQDLDLEGEFVYAINFSANDPSRVVRGVTFLPDRLGIPGATLVGPQQAAPWSTKPEFGVTADANALEEILYDIRWANSAGGERLKATLKVTPGEEYKLQVLISGNGPEDRCWDIRVNGKNAVDEITSLGVSPGQSYARNRATLYTYQFPATSASVVVEMGNLFGANDGANRDPLWQALTLEKVTIPPTPDDMVLQSASFFPSQTQPIGTVQVLDQRFGATHTLRLVGGDGSEDNAKFSLDGANLLARPFDFSSQAPGASYSIRLLATDDGDPKRFFEKAFTLTLVEAHAPTEIKLDASSVSRAAWVGSVVGNLSAADADEFDRHTFQLVAGAGDGENAQFAVEAGTLKLARSLALGAAQFHLRIRATDRAELSVERAFVLPVVEPKVRINEILSSEVAGVVDETRLPQEWIELHNELEQTVDLTGWYLTDDRQDLRKWSIPSRTLAPGGFLVVLADGTGAVVPGSTNLHANFSLSASGEWIGLVWPDGAKIASELQFPAQYPAVAYGYGPEGTLGYLPQPTPGQTNGSVATAGENAVTYSRTHGFETQAFALELHAAVPGSTLRYTLDGTQPTPTSGTIYSGPILVTPNTTGTTRGLRIIRAMAVNSSAAYAPVATHTYIFVNGVAGPAVDGVVSQSRLLTSITKNATYGPLMSDAFLALPAVSMVMSGSVSTTERKASIELFDPKGREAGFQIDCGIEATGTTSLSSPKLSMAAKFRPEYGQSHLRYPLFARGSMAPVPAVAEFKELRVRSHSHDTFLWLGTKENPPTPYGSPAVTRSGDAQLTRNPWIDEMQLLMGQPGKHGRQVHLFLNGSYHGIYHIHEHPDDDFMAGYYPGRAEDYHFTSGATTGTEHSASDTWVKAWSSVKASLSNYAQARRWVDVTNLCDYMVLSFYGGNDWDWSAQHNWAAAGSKYADRGGWKFFENDSDIVLQDVNADSTDQDVPDGIFTRLMTYPDFRMLFRDRVYKHCFGNGLLTPARAGTLYDARMNELTHAIIAESARWQPSSSVGRLPWDRDEEWSNEWTYLREIYFPQRTAVLIAQFRKHTGWWPVDPPSLSLAPGEVPQGAPLSFSFKTGKVYFTTDGSDPRLTGGAINPGAHVATGVSTVLTHVLIPAGASWRFLDDGSNPVAKWTARGFDDSRWRKGATEIGYGHGDEATLAKFIDTDAATPEVQKNLTTYFRRTFELPANSTATALKLRMLCDDGAVVYVNGREVWRVNLPVGAITRDKLATTEIEGAQEATWIETTVQAGAFTPDSAGNVVAVEVHQASPDSPDMSFNFDLSAQLSVTVSDPVVMEGPFTLLKARVYAGNDWSALVESYVVPEGTVRASAANLVLSEIHYHPLDLPDSEFLEFLNTSPSTVDLSGVVVSNAVNFSFPNATLLAPGARVLAVKNSAVFDSRYRTAGSAYFRADLQVVGPWDGSLSNEGETIDVLGADGARIFSVAYGSSGAWPGRADGGGSSLELADPESAPLSVDKKSAWLAEPHHWRPSSEFHGSPGVAGADPDNRIFINEVVAAPLPGDTDGIELLNVSGHTVAVGRWFLSDSSADYRKYRFPDGVSMEPGARLALRAADFGDGTNPACLTPFGLSELGDDVFLIESAADGSLLRFVDQVEFGGMPRGVAFGRFPDGSGPLVWLREPTLGFPNSIPVAGYEAWAATAFPVGTPAEKAAQDADPDGDGLSNFAEYAFVTSPNRADGAPLEVLAGTAEEGVRMTYRVRTAASGLTYQIEISPNLKDWSPPGDGVEIVAQDPQPDGAILVTVRVLPAAGDAGSSGRFLRIAVQSQ